MALGDMRAQACIGLCYYYGQGFEENHEKAFELWRAAASKGEETAQKMLSDHV